MHSWRKEQKERDAATKVKCSFIDFRKSRSKENDYEKLYHFIM